MRELFSFLHKQNYSYQTQLCFYDQTSFESFYDRPNETMTEVFSSIFNQVILIDYYCNYLFDWWQEQNFKSPIAKLSTLRFTRIL